MLIDRTAEMKTGKGRQTGGRTCSKGLQVGLEPTGLSLRTWDGSSCTPYPATFVDI